jgi:hypothetical protein
MTKQKLKKKTLLFLEVPTYTAVLASNRGVAQ